MRREGIISKVEVIVKRLCSLWKVNEYFVSYYAMSDSKWWAVNNRDEIVCLIVVVIKRSRLRCAVLPAMRVRYR